MPEPLGTESACWLQLPRWNRTQTLLNAKLDDGQCSQSYGLAPSSLIAMGIQKPFKQMVEQLRTRCNDCLTYLFIAVYLFVIKKVCGLNPFKIIPLLGMALKDLRIAELSEGVVAEMPEHLPTEVNAPREARSLARELFLCARLLLRACQNKCRWPQRALSSPG